MKKLLFALSILLSFVSSAQKIKITPKTINGQSATHIEVRLLNYDLTATATRYYYAYYNASGLRLAEGNIAAGNVVDGEAAIESAVEAITGNTSSINVVMHDLLTSSYKIQYTTTGGVTGYLYMSGGYITNESTILSTVFTALSVTAYETTVKLVFVGDSNTAGTSGPTSTAFAFPALLDAAYGTNVTVSNLGAGGSKSADWLLTTNQNAINAAYDATKDVNIMVLMIGTNDFINGTPVALTTTEANITTLVSNAKTTGYKVILMEPAEANHDYSMSYNDKDFSDFHSLAYWISNSQNTLGVSEIVTAYFDHYIGQYRTDVAAYWQQPDVGGSVDYVHYGNTGHVRWRDIIKPAIDRVIAGTNLPTLPPPTYATVTDGNAQIGFTWPTVTGATTYHLLKNTTFDPFTATEVYAGSTAAYTDATVTNGTRRYYWLYAEGSGYNNSPYIPLDGTASTTALSTPTSLSPTPTSTQVSLSWSAVSGAASYQIFRNTTNTFASAIPIATVTGTTYTDLDGDNVQILYYFVVAQDPGNDRRSSAAVTPNIDPNGTATYYTVATNGTHGKFTNLGDWTFHSGPDFYYLPGGAIPTPEGDRIVIPFTYGFKFVLEDAGNSSWYTGANYIFTIKETGQADVIFDNLNGAQGATLLEYHPNTTSSKTLLIGKGSAGGGAVGPIVEAITLYVQ